MLFLFFLAQMKNKNRQIKARPAGAAGLAITRPTRSPQSSNGGEEDNGSGDGVNLTTVVGGAAMGAGILVMVIVIMRQRAQQQPQPATQQVFPPVNNPAFEPEYATMNYDVVGNVMPPQAPQYDTVGFMRDQKYAVLGPHSTYNSVETDA